MSESATYLKQRLDVFELPEKQELLNFYERIAYLEVALDGLSPHE